MWEWIKKLIAIWLIVLIVVVLCVWISNPVQAWYRVVGFVAFNGYLAARILGGKRHAYQ